MQRTAWIDTSGNQILEQGYLNKIRDGRKTDLEEFIRFLEHYGTVKRETIGKKTYFVFMWDDESVHTKRTRNAGKKPELSNRTVAEVYAYRQEHTAKETAAFAGMSLRTYQRAVSALKAEDLWKPVIDNMQFGKPQSFFSNP